MKIRKAFSLKYSHSSSLNSFPLDHLWGSVFLFLQWSLKAFFKHTADALVMLHAYSLVLKTQSTESKLLMQSSLLFHFASSILISHSTQQLDRLSKLLSKGTKLLLSKFPIILQFHPSYSMAKTLESMDFWKYKQVWVSIQPEVDSMVTLLLNIRMEVR